MADRCVLSVLTSLSLVFALITVFALSGCGIVLAAADRSTRVLVIYSSGVNNNYVHKGEYDQVLKDLGWEFDLVENTEIGQWSDRLADYDIILTTGLWNYGNSRDLRPYAGKFRAFLESGGLAIFADMNYPAQVDWLRELGAEFAVKSEGVPKGQEGIFQRKVAFFDSPRPGANGAFWSHFIEWGEAYKVAATDWSGLPVILVARVGKGTLVVTTLFGMTTAAVANLADNSARLAAGETFQFVEPPAEPRVVLELVGSHFARRELIRGSVKLEVPPGVIEQMDKEALRLETLAMPRRSIGERILLETISLAKILGNAKTADTRLGIETEWQFEYPAGRLAEGEYYLAARLVASDGVVAGHAAELVVCDASVASVVKIGDDLTTLVNDELFFPIGTYHVASTDLGLIKELGFNFVVSPLVSSQLDLPKLLEFMNEAERHGLKVLIEYSELVRNQRQMFTDIASLTSALRFHPATLGYYLVDEPGAGVSEDDMRKGYYAIKAADRLHPVFVLEVTASFFELHSRWTDIFSTDPYVIGSHVDDIAGVGRATRQALAATRYTKPVWTAIQAHRAPSAGSTNRWPTPDELRAMSYLALNHGAKGLIFYGYGDSLDGWGSGFKFNKELMDFFPRLNRELAEMGPRYLLDSAYGFAWASTEADGIDVRLIGSDGQFFVVAVNCTNREITADIQLDGLPYVPSLVTVEYESRAVRVEEGKIRDHFAPFAVHVYRL
ncbi:MAG: hypothetical protein IMX00_09805 [Limnochordales bacterium]|nr:hypothetical protein [Limnochordales bacterium]